jgi:hypothetical protein
VNVFNHDRLLFLLLLFIASRCLLRQLHTLQETSFLTVVVFVVIEHPYFIFVGVTAVAESNLKTHFYYSNATINLNE